jgi:hypothetical protein
VFAVEDGAGVVGSGEQTAGLRSEATAVDGRLLALALHALAAGLFEVRESLAPRLFGGGEVAHYQAHLLHLFRVGEEKHERLVAGGVPSGFAQGGFALDQKFGFHTAGAFKAPPRVGRRTKEFVLEIAGRAVVFFEGSVEGFVRCAVFPWKERGFAGEAVTDAVETASILSLVRFRSGGELRVGAIGGEFGGGGHGGVIVTCEAAEFRRFRPEGIEKKGKIILCFPNRAVRVRGDFKIRATDARQ